MPKTVSSNFLEFGYELLSALPYAYYLHTRKQLKNTISAIDTKCLYYFSPDHKEIDKKRSFKNLGVAKSSGIPNTYIHTPHFDFSKFRIPDYRKVYANDQYKWSKPTVIICNRINKEWGRNPLNYFDLPILKRMFNLLKDKYQIVYINIEGRKEYYDGAPPISIGDFDMIKKDHPEVINIHDLKSDSFNELQLKIFANCKHYITMNGGHSILASYFKGKNIIYSKQGNTETKELKMGSFWRWYPKINDSEIYYSRNYDDLIETIKQVYVEKLPKLNILSRTSNRPNFFNSMMHGVSSQTYKNINVILGIEKGQPDNYTFKKVAYPVYYDELKVDPTRHRNSAHYGRHFPFNLYQNKLAKEVKDGWVMYLDDDGIFTIPESAVKIMTAITNRNSLILWRVMVSNRSIPNDENFGNKPVCKDICGTGFLFHSKHLKSVRWTQWKRADYRVVAHLYEKLNPKWIDLVLTKNQRSTGTGMGNRGDKIIVDSNNFSNQTNSTVMKVKVIKDKYKGKPFSEMDKILDLDKPTAQLFISRGLVQAYDPKKDEGKKATDEKAIEKATKTIAEQKEIIDLQIPDLTNTIKDMKAEKVEYKNKMEKKVFENKESHKTEIKQLKEKNKKEAVKLKKEITNLKKRVK